MDIKTPFTASSSGRSSPVSASPAGATLIDIDHVDFYYGASQALHDINLKIEEKKVTAFNPTLSRNPFTKTSLTDSASRVAPISRISMRSWKNRCVELRSGMKSKTASTLRVSVFLVDNNSVSVSPAP